jgi:formylglycine-generating enzyme required for sulfatase activity
MTAAATEGLVCVPAGSYVVGTDNPWLPADGEGPARTVEIASFRIAPCAVSVAEFATFVAATGFVTDAERAGWSFVFAGEVDESAKIAGRAAGAPWWLGVRGATWRDALDVSPDHPVVHVSWHDANAYCRWLGARLPTEAEWEAAASGFEPGRTFPWGNELTPGGVHLCNTWQGSFPGEDIGEDGFRGRAPVDAFPPNDFGLFNMVGNVWEWSADTLRGGSTPETCCTPTSAADERVQKGGSYLCHASYCARYRIQARIGSSPDSSTSNTGFRVAG